MSKLRLKFRRQGPVYVPPAPPPVFLSSASRTTLEGASADFTVTVNEASNFSIVGGANQAQFTLIGGGSQNVTLRIAPQTFGGSNDYTVVVRATSIATGQSADQTIVVSITASAYPASVRALNLQAVYDLQTTGAGLANASLLATPASSGAGQNLPSGSSVDSQNVFLTQTAGTYTISNVDFTGRTVYVDGNVTVTFNNCRFGVGPYFTIAFAFNNSAFTPTVYVNDCDFNMAGASGVFEAPIYGKVNFIARRCRFYDSPGNAMSTPGGSWDIQNCLFWRLGRNPGSKHLDCIGHLYSGTAIIRRNLVLINPTVPAGTWKSGGGWTGYFFPETTLGDITWEMSENVLVGAALSGNGGYLADKAVFAVQCSNKSGYQNTGKFINNAMDAGTSGYIVASGGATVVGYGNRDYDTNVPFDPVILSNFGAKTLTGHGAHWVNHPDVGTLSIVSAKDASNADSTIWQIGQNALSWKGASATYGSAAPSSLSGSYTVTVSDGTYRAAIKVTVLANTFTVREMAAVAQGGRWATDSMYTVDGVATSGPTQLRTVMLGTTLVLGDTIRLRDGVYNPTSADVRMRPKAGGYTGSGVITIRGDNPDTSSDLNGMPQRKHGARYRRLIFDSAASGDMYFPFQITDLWLESNQTGTATVLSYANDGWGVSLYNCRVAYLPGTAGSSCRGIVLRGSQTNVVSVQNSTFTNLSKAIVIESSAGTGGAGRTKGARIINNDAFELYEDMITDSGEATIVEDNFSRDYLNAGLADHSDAYQHMHDGKSPTTYDGPQVRRNIVVVNPAYSFAPQGYFSDDTALARTLTNVVIENNIAITGAANGVFLARTTAPSARMNTILSWVQNTNASLNAQVTVPVGKAGTDGTFNLNTAVGVTVDPQTGTVVKTPNTTLTKSLTAYRVAFPSYNEGLYTRAAVRAALTPANVAVTSGGCRNPDGTYNGAIGPDGQWNTGLAYTKLDFSKASNSLYVPLINS